MTAAGDRSGQLLRLRDQWNRHSVRPSFAGRFNGWQPAPTLDCADGRVHGKHLGGHTRTPGMETTIRGGWTRQTSVILR
jgi:hypothetical protein